MIYGGDSYVDNALPVMFSNMGDVGTNRQTFIAYHGTVIAYHQTNRQTLLLMEESLLIGSPVQNVRVKSIVDNNCCCPV